MNVTKNLACLIAASTLLCSCANKNSKSQESAEETNVESVEENQTFVAEEGAQYLDITVPSLKAPETIKLSQFVENNKLTLVDCWASWCGPCMAEMPNLVNIYANYHEAGLEIVGISFDKEREDWQNAVDRLNMTWPQGSELNGWENQMMEKYGVQSIPCTFLINQQGTILAIGLRGEELEAKIKETLGL